jgi:hypothetical protein
MEKKKMIGKNFTCKHDYKNAIQIGSVDYVCPLCKQVLDPLEWFLMNSFEFVDVVPEAEHGPAKNHKKKKSCRR